jgi:hypothetical protein
LEFAARSIVKSAVITAPLRRDWRRNAAQPGESSSMPNGFVT